MANFILPNGGTTYVANGTFDNTHATKIQNDLSLLVQGQVCRNEWVGGSISRGLIGSSVVDVLDAVDFYIDNSSTQWSGSSGITVPITVWCRVANSGISVTPRIYNVTDAGAATVSGAAACSATATDFSGTNQKQTLLLTLASGTKYYRLQLTPSAATYPVYVMGWRALYI